MYLARHARRGRPCYTIRLSFRDEKTTAVRNLDLYDLGEDPSRFIRYPGGNAFYIDLREAKILAEDPPSLDEARLEEIFWPFVRPAIREALTPFIQRRRFPGRMSEKRSVLKSRIVREIHPFDARRLCTLRLGRTVSLASSSHPPAFLCHLLDKSRDELEQFFLALEETLDPREIKQYVVSIFDLRRFFPGVDIRHTPYLMEGARLDSLFLQELESMRREEKFWAGLDDADRAREYIDRYATMYRSHNFSPERFLGSFWNEFMNRRRVFGPPASPIRVSTDEIFLLLGRPMEEILLLNRKELGRLFRSRAKELHPDAGGAHDAFVRLKTAYEDLLHRLRKS